MSKSQYWQGANVERDSPATHAIACTPSDTTTQIARALYIGTGGTVVVIPIYSELPVTFQNVPDGSFLQVSVKKVMAATTASDILLIDPKE